MKRPSFFASNETASIVAIIRQMSIGQDMSFEDLSKSVGFKVISTTPAYQSARHICLSQHGIVTDSIRGVGFRRLSGSETVGKSDKHMASIRRRASHGSKELSTAMRSNLTTDEMIDATRKQAAYGVILMNAQKMRKPKEYTPPPPVAMVPQIP